MKEKQMKRVIDSYIKAYNEFNVDEMVKNIHQDIEFKNIAGGEVNVHIKGLDILKKQAEQSAGLFKKRKMTITQQTIKGDAVENKIDFTAILAMDIPDGPKAGEIIKIKGKSIFKFKNGKIILIEDVN